MSLDKHITECFKMKKPKPSPGKGASGVLTTPKRRAARSKLASGHRVASTASTSIVKAGGSRRDASPDPLDQSCYETAVGLNTIADDLLCSQDVDAADVMWESSPRKKVIKARKNGESDVKDLFKHFRPKPQDAKPAALSLLDVTRTSYNYTPPRARPDRPQMQKKLASDTPNAQVVMDEVQILFNMVKHSMQNDSKVASTSCASDPEEAETTATEPTFPPTPGDEEKWAGEDDSLLVAATQEVEMTAGIRTPLRTAKAAVFQTPPNVPSLVSPLRCRPNRPSPRDRSSFSRKSPRLQALSLNRTPSPWRLRSIIPVAVPTAKGQALTKSPGPVFDEDDEDEALLDLVCSTYEQQQELEKKMAAKCLPQRADGGKTTTSSRPNKDDTSALLRGVNAAASEFLSSVPTCGAGFKPCGASCETTQVVPETAGTLDEVSFGSDATDAAEEATSRFVSTRDVAFKGSIASRVPTPLAMQNETRSGVAGPASGGGKSVASLKTIPALSIICNTKAPPPTLQPGAHDKTHASSVVSSGPNSWVVSTTATGRTTVCNGSRSSAASQSIARPPSSISTPVAATTRKPPTVQKSKSPHRNQTRAQLSKARASAAHVADTSLDFGDDDDLDFTTPDVVSWLEKVESQRAPSQKCTPEEIARKREEALRRRQLKAAQTTHQWRGRLRPSR